MGDVLTGVAALGTLITGVGALAAWRNTRDAKDEAQKIHIEVKTNHGMRAGEYLELIHADVRDLRSLIVEHITDRNAHN